MMCYTDKVKAMIERDYRERVANHSDLMRTVDIRISALEEEEISYSVKFVFAHLPLSDLGEETMFTTVLDYAITAAKARKQMPWSSEIPMEIFLSEVLFPRVNNEWLEPSRGLFYELLAHRVRHKSLREAIIETNYFCFEQATYVGSDMRTVPPTTMLKSARGRCGEESVFVIMALRSIGIPARQIYVPRWAHCDDNHAWVEVWCDGQWHYLGACEPEEELDRGWFTSASSRAVLVESKAFYQPVDPGSHVCEESVRSGITRLVNRTGHYAPAVKLKITVKDMAGQPVSGVRIIPKIINGAKLDPISELITDNRGCAEITIGKGSVCLHVTDGSKYMEQWVNTAEQDTAELIFVPEIAGDRIAEFDTMAPVITGKTNPPLTADIRMRQKARTEQALKLRKAKEAEFLSGEAGCTENRFADIINCDVLGDMLVKARGNYSEIIAFLEENPTVYAALLLTTLNEKDYSDCNKDILAGHLKYAASYIGLWEEDIYVNYVLAPRIYFEHMTDYREELSRAFSHEQKESFRADPAGLWDYIEASITFLSEEETSNILATPAAVIRSGYGSLMSKKILFVAVLRSLGIPARMTKETCNIEYYNGSEFIAVIQEETADSCLHLSFGGESNWMYGGNWSVSALRNQIFEPLNLRDRMIEDHRMVLMLPHGYYRIITSNRLPNGNTYSRQYDIVLELNGKKEVELTLRPISEKDMITKARINAFGVENPAGGQADICDYLSKGQNILVWLAEDHEPSQHILNEMIAAHSRFCNRVPVTFILDHADGAKNVLIARAAGLLGACMVIDPEAVNAEPTARLTFVDPDKLPLAVITDGQLNTSYAVSGYNVGTAEMMLKILDMIC